MNYSYGWALVYIQESLAIEHGVGIPGFSTMAIYLPKEDVFLCFKLRTGKISIQQH